MRSIITSKPSDKPYVSIVPGMLVMFKYLTGDCDVLLLIGEESIAVVHIGGSSDDRIGNNWFDEYGSLDNFERDKQAYLYPFTGSVTLCN